MDEQRAANLANWEDRVPIHTGPNGYDLDAFTDPEHVSKPSELRLESRFSEETLDGLRERGHQVVELGPWGAPAAVQVILRQPNGLLELLTDSGEAIGRHDRFGAG